MINLFYSNSFNIYVRRLDEISLISAIKKIVIYRPFCSRHFALKIITLAYLYPIQSYGQIKNAKHK